MKDDQPIVISGCQRSGNTLVHLVLDSHPQVKAIDEDEFDSVRFLHAPRSSEVRPAFKLPMVSHEVAGFRDVAGLKIVWCLRDPRDVVSSMLELPMPLAQGAVSWSVHPRGAEKEVVNCAATLGSSLSAQRFTLLEAFEAIKRKAPQNRNRAEAVFSASLCWRLKQELLPVYDRLEMPYHVVRYEHLLSKPKAIVGELLGFLDLPWHDDVLRHHQLHSGTAVGATDRGRPIDATNTGKWKQSLRPADVEIVRAVCYDVARAHDYDLAD